MGKRKSQRNNWVKYRKLREQNPDIDPRISSHVFCGRRYAVDTETCDGYCDTSKPDYTIGFPGRLENHLRDLRLEIHEAIHACFPLMSEEKVTESSVDLARFLWRMGYRRKKR
jgi:hypothetical protein